jgi:hypothetical protein
MISKARFFTGKNLRRKTGSGKFKMPVTLLPARGSQNRRLQSYFTFLRLAVDSNHCGYPPCGTYWGAYTAPATGRLTVNNLGTTYPAILSVYTGPPTSYTNPSPVACSSGQLDLLREVRAVLKKYQRLLL